MNLKTNKCGCKRHMHAMQHMHACRLQQRIAQVSVKLKQHEAAREQAERFELKHSMHESEVDKLRADVEPGTLEGMGDEMTLAELSALMDQV